MFLEFPDLDTLQLALTSGLVPTEVSTAPVTAALGTDGTVRLDPSVKLALAAHKGLVRLGAQTVAGPGSSEPISYRSWLQLLPLRREATPASITGQTPVLFELPSSRLLPGLVGEMLRLGNDRQGFRYLDQTSDTPAVLLRVIGPPYYSLLQALDRDGQPDAPRAYLERAPRLWVEIGWTHSLAEQITPPADKLLFLRPPREWNLLEEAPFRDIYEILEFPLPSAPVTWHDAQHHDRLAIPLRLVPSSSADLPELWVLRDNALEQLENFVRNASDTLLTRLSFAVGVSDGRQCVVVRLRPSKQAPPVVMLEGQGFRPYLKLPNLYLPCDRLLMPQLRRDAVRNLLVGDPEQITWLYPHPDGTFTPESLPDQVFRPLPEWVDYVLSINRAELAVWVESAQFDFERFVCKDDQKPERKPREKGEKAPRSPRHQASSTEDPSGTVRFKVKKGEVPPKAEEMAPLEVGPALEPSELQRRQQNLEERFLQAEGALDAPERQALWPELALTYTALNNLGDAAVCWANALWDESAEAPRWVAAWHAANFREHHGQPADRLLDRLLKLKDPAPGDLRLLATFVLYSAHSGEPEPALAARLNRVQTYLQTHEAMLPVRLVWLVGLALYRLSGGDVLALARTRDRILARLFQAGLTVEQDLPAFLRFSGASYNARFQAFRDWLMKLPERVRHWLTKINVVVGASAPGETLAYADLILAFGFARLGERDLALELQRRAEKKLGSGDEVHECLEYAFSYRIEQALAGSPPTGPLPAEMHKNLTKLDRIPRYMVDRFRQLSRILEPHEKINPYRAWHGSHGDDLGKVLSGLTDIHDPKVLEEAIHAQLARHTKKDAATRRHRARIVSAGIELSPRVGQAFALPLLAEVLDACNQFKEFLDQASLLEKAIFVAAHFDQPSLVKQFVARFQELLRAERGGGNQPALESLASQCFRSLRKLGLRDVIEQLLAQLSDSLLQGKPVGAYRGTKDWPALLRSLLQVAAGWYYFGMNEPAKPIIEETRQLLYKGELDRYEIRKLARAYVATLGQAPAEVALRGIDELFGKLTGICDTFTTHYHYSLSQIEIVEAVVLAIVTEDFAMGGQARRWLDDDEYLVRQRIHHDLQRAMGQA
jgi:hypothetical protein